MERFHAELSSGSLRVLARFCAELVRFGQSLQWMSQFAVFKNQQRITLLSKCVFAVYSMSYSTAPHSYFSMVLLHHCTLSNLSFICFCCIGRGVRSARGWLPIQSPRVGELRSTHADVARYHCARLEPILADREPGSCRANSLCSRSAHSFPVRPRYGRAREVVAELFLCRQWEVPGWGRSPSLSQAPCHTLAATAAEASGPSSGPWRGDLLLRAGRGRKGRAG